MNKTEIRKLIGGFARVKEIREGKSLQSENSVEVVLQERFMNIGNLEALKGRGFEFLGSGITDDGYLYIAFGSYKKLNWSEIGQ